MITKDIIFAATNKLKLKNTLNDLKGSKSIIYISNVDAPRDAHIYIENSENIDSVIFLNFDDVEYGEKNCITSNDCDKIYNFILLCIEIKSDNIVIVCDGGISRSVGIYAGLMFSMEKDDILESIFNNPLFCPNRACFESIIKRVCGNEIAPSTMQYFDNLFNKQLKLWKENQIKEGNL